MPEEDPPSKLISLSALLSQAKGLGWLNAFSGPLERFLGLTYLNESYDRVKTDSTPENFYAKAQRSMDISYEVSDEDLDRIPREGPTLVVTNHPFGGVDGVAFGAMLGTVRDDFKLMANYLLAHMVEIKPWLIGVDPFETKESARRNLTALKDTIRFLRDGGCVGMFPSGTVSHYHANERRVTDPKWNANTGRLVQKTQATVVPVYFEGGNGPLFQLAGMINPRLRTLLLPREMMKANGITLRIRIGQPLPYKKLSHLEDPQKLTEFLRLKTYLLKERQDNAPKKHFHLPKLPRKTGEMQPIVDPVDPALLEEEVNALPEEQHLVEHGNFLVAFAFAEQIPHLLDEIGRLREKTFREVGEGTGEPIDLDRFDVYYRHLFTWDRVERKIVGSYRFGATDEILLTRGKRGLYTTTLFKFKPGFLEAMDPALEMGRSFIASEYQKKHASLLLLWRGIGAFLVRYPRYKFLFGPVSISAEYNAISKDLMVKFLQKEKLDPELAQLVKARKPPKGGPRLRGQQKQALLQSVHDIDDISAIISEIETDQKGIPTLLRHYLKMNGQLLSFNVDAEFGNCVDGLIVVDMTKSDPRLLKSYLGPEGHLEFLKYHGVEIEAKM